MNPFNNEFELVYVNPGNFHFSKTPIIISTVLGSCVSVTMHSKRLKAGGLTHGLLPNCKKKQKCDGDCLEGFKYVDCSIRRLADMFNKIGIKNEEIDVKIFGGADMFDVKVNSSITVGRMNIEKAIEEIMIKNFNIVAKDVGGIVGRKIFFNTVTGEVLLKKQRKL